jgi:DNA-binding phage protein
MSSIARPVGLGRERLYKFLSFSRDSELATVLKVISALRLPMDVRIKRNAKLAV